VSTADGDQKAATNQQWAQGGLARMTLHWKRRKMKAHKVILIAFSLVLRILDLMALFLPPFNLQTAKACAC